MDRHLPSRFVIRAATPSDATAVINAINAICAEGGAFYVPHFIPSPEWRAVLYQPESVPAHLLLVAEHEDEVIGVGRLFPGAPHSFLCHVGELGLLVLKPHRRHGIASLLLHKLLECAVQQGLEKVTLSVFASNAPAIALYRKFGFMEEGRYCRHLKIGAQYEALILMSRFL